MSSPVSEKTRLFCLLSTILTRSVENQTMSESMNAISHLADFEFLKTKLIQRWLDLETHSNAFRYKLNIRDQKILDGDLKFFIQVSVANNRKTFYLVSAGSCD